MADFAPEFLRLQLLFHDGVGTVELLYPTSQRPLSHHRRADARIVSRWRSVDDPGEVFSQRIEWHSRGMMAPLTIDIPELFTDALE